MQLVKRILAINREVLDEGELAELSPSASKKPNKFGRLLTWFAASN